MITVEEQIMTRLTGDNSGSGNLQTLLGGANRIYHAFEKVEPKRSSITYHVVTNIPGDVNADQIQTRNEFYQFNIYHKQYEVVLARLRRLLHNYQFPVLSDGVIHGSVWDWEGPDEYDEGLQVGLKHVRYRIFAIEAGQAPI